MKTTLSALFAVLMLANLLHAQSPRRPNVLFIMTDQQFADAMSCRMGNQYIQTPAMDSLARNGVVFSRAYVPNPLCMPARNSIFTGMYPHQTSVTNNSCSEMDTSKFSCLGTVFREAGYQTAYFGKWHLCFRTKDVEEHGFETMSEVKRVGAWDIQISSSAIEFLKQPHEQPFLAVVSFHNPHDACELARGQPLPGGPIGDPPPPEQCPPVPMNLEPPQNEPDGMAMLRRGYHASSMFPVGDFSPDKWRQQRWGYYRLVEKVDRELGAVLNALRESGQDSNTVVVFTSDHGECSGAHQFNQKTVFYDEAARVPMIIRFTAQTKPRVTDLLVNTGIDLLPTLCDFAGIEVPKETSGMSLLPIVLGQSSEPSREFIVVQNDMAQAGPIGGETPRMQGRMVRTDQFKYCVYEYGTRRESLIDMKADPLESNNLAGKEEHREILRYHRKLLAQFGKEQGDSLVDVLLSNNVGPRPFPEAE